MSNIIDREFCDVLVDTKYPFMDDADLVSTIGFSLPLAFFVNADITVHGPVDMPIRLHSVKRIDDTVHIELVDNADNIVLTGSCLLSARFIELTGEGEGRLELGRASSILPDNKKLEFDNLPFVIGLTHRIPIGDSELAGISINGELLTGSSFVLAAGYKTKFRAVTGGSIKLDLFGDSVQQKKRLLSINGCSVPHIWIGATPESSVKMEPSEDGLLVQEVLDDN
jgi:hypothetical protein